MIQKESPRCLSALGANQEGGKITNLACPHHATPSRPAQAESCDRCQFFRAVALPSGRERRLCLLSGEKLRTAAGGGELFAPGTWKELWADPAPAPVKAGSAVSVRMASCRPSGPPSSALWDAAPIICRTGAAGLSSAPASR